MIIDTVVFERADSGAATETKPLSTPGEIMGVWVEHSSGSGDITLTIEAYGVSTTVYTEATPADGAFNPVRRMQTTAGADNSGAGEFHHFWVPDGGLLKLTIAAAWTGNVIVSMRR